MKFTVGVAVGLGVAAVAGTRGPVAGWLIASVLARHAGIEYQAGWASLRLDGRLVLDAVRLRVPGRPGLEGEFLRADRIVLDFDAAGLWDGTSPLRRVTLERPTLRLSVGEGGRLNVLDISLRGGGSAGSARLPALVTTDGQIELGDHADGVYRTLANLAVQATMSPDPGDAGVYHFQLEEQRPSGLADAVRITGFFAPRRGLAEAELARVDLGTWSEARVPEAVRLAWQKLAMRGQLAGAKLRVSRGGGVEADLTVHDVALTLPIEADRPEVAAGRGLAMTGVSGTLRVRQGGRWSAEGSVQAELSGRVGDLPAEILLSTDGLDPVTAGVELQWWSRQFEVSRNPELAPYLPPLVRKRLQQFSGPTAIVDAFVRVRRDKTDRPPVGPPSPAAWSIGGSVQFANGRAAFDQFPYPFFDLSGRISFDDREIRIADVTGRGLSGARLLASGRTWPTDDPMEVELHVDVTDAPIDSALAAAADRRVAVAQAVLDTMTPERLAAWRERQARGDAPPADPLADILGPQTVAELSQREGSWRGGLFQSLFSTRRLADLRAGGMVLSSAEHADLEQALGRLRAERDALGPGTGPAEAAALSAIAESEAALLEKLDRPVFDLGGTARHLAILVKRNPLRKHYDAYVRADLGQAGIVPDGFPLPLYARRLDLDILEHDMKVRAEVGRSLRGGVALVDGRIDLERLAETGGLPELRVQARDLLVDQVLVRALPDRGADAPAGSAPSARAMLERLNLRGLVDTTARLWPSEADPRKPALDVDITLKNLAARPAAFDGVSPPVLVAGLTGSIRVDDQHVQVDGLRGWLWPGEASVSREARQPDLVGPLALDAPAFADPAAAAVTLDARVPVRPAPGESAVTARIGVERLDLATRLEDLIAPVSPAGAAKVADLRQARAPIGRLDAQAELTVMPTPAPLPGAPADPPVDLRVRVARSEGLELSAFGGRLGIAQRSGSVAARLIAAANTPVRLEAQFDRLDLALAHDGAPAADLTLSGPLVLPAVNDPAGVDLPAPLEITLRSARLDSAPARSLLAAASPDAADWAATHRLRGDLAGDLTLSTRDGSVVAAGLITPLWLGLDRDGTSVDIHTLRGRLRLDPGLVALEQLRLDTPAWALALDGTLRLPTRGPAAAPWSADLRLDASARGIDATLLAVLPDAAAAALRSSQAQATGGISLEGGTLTLLGRAGGAGGLDRGVFAGEIRFAGLALDAGVAVADAHGRVGVRAELGPGDPRVTLDVEAASLRVADLMVANGRAVARTGAADGSVLVEPIEGAVYGGRVAGRAVIRPGVAPEAPRRYEAGLRVAGVRFADVLADLNRAAEQRRLRTFVGPLSPEEAARLERGEPLAALPPLEPGDASRGRVDAELTLAGLVGREGSRRGRGSLRVSGGDIIRLPLILPMMELSNLGLPSGDRLDFAQATFLVDGPTVAFDRIALLSGSLSVLGWGTLRLPDYDLALRFNSRGRAQLPLISGLFEGLRNELITTTVTGTVDDPQINAESFSGTRRLLDTMFGRPEAVAMPDFARLDAEARAERDRARGG